MIDYNNIIESVSVKFNKLRSVSFLKATTIKDLIHDDNLLIINRRGWLLFEDENLEIAPGEYLFITAGSKVKLSFQGKSGQQISAADFHSGKGKVYNPIKSEEAALVSSNHFLFLSFSSKVIESVEFFNSLEISPFRLSNSEKMDDIINKMWAEKTTKEDGYERAIKNYAEILVVELVRHMISSSMFVENFVTNAEYFKDPRLLEIFQYVKNNIRGDLSNKMLADIVNVSEDYVGQYFKALTGINPQDYVEYQRMQYAIYLLRNTNKSIYDVGKDSGYKDTAYFCRRFKMLYGIPAAKLRKRELNSMLNA